MKKYYVTIFQYDKRNEQIGSKSNKNKNFDTLEEAQKYFDSITLDVLINDSFEDTDFFYVLLNNEDDTIYIEKNIYIEKEE